MQPAFLFAYNAIVPWYITISQERIHKAEAGSGQSLDKYYFQTDYPGGDGGNIHRDSGFQTPQ